MRILILFTILLFSCGQAKENTKPANQSTTVTQESSAQKVDTNNAAETPVAGMQTDEDIIKEIIKANFGGKWRLVTRADLPWDDRTFKKEIKPGMRNEFNNPHFVKADINCDGKPDYAALITDDSKYYKRLIVRMAILTTGQTPVIWKNDPKADSWAGAWLYVTKAKSFLAYDLTRDDIPVKMICEGVEIIEPGIGGAILYWTGKEYKEMPYDIN